MLLHLVDPSNVLRSLPGKEHDLFIAANNSHVLTFDNVSVISNWQSDALCRIATGGGFAARQLYSDDEETTFSVCRPIMMNGIGEIVSRPDLADRSISLTLSPIADENRQTESELWAAYDDAKPAILGSLLDALAEGLRQLPNTKVKGGHRMADALQWAVACGSALWPAGAVEEAWSRNRGDLEGQMLAGDPVAGALREFMKNRPAWEGTSTNLLHVLTQVNGAWPLPPTWPRTARGLKGCLERIKPSLRRIGIGIDYTRDPGKNRDRLVHIRNDGVEAAPAASDTKFQSGPVIVAREPLDAANDDFAAGMIADATDAADEVQPTALEKVSGKAVVMKIAKQ
jgi:hypothetical protein